MTFLDFLQIGISLVMKIIRIRRSHFRPLNGRIKIILFQEKFSKSLFQTRKFSVQKQTKNNQENEMLLRFKKRLQTPPGGPDSVTRFGNLLDFGRLLKAFGNN